MRNRQVNKYFKKKGYFMSKELSQMTLKELWRLFPIKLEKHNEEWKEWYVEQKQTIEEIVGDYIVRISHIGSTAIKGIWAKPIVDILLEANYDDFNTITDILKENSWICMSDSGDKRAFNKGYTKNGFAKKVYHLHLRKKGDCDELYFRDYLENNKEVAQEYQNLKMLLWEKYEYNRDGYTKAKTAFIEKNTKIAKQKYNHRL